MKIFVDGKAWKGAVPDGAKTGRELLQALGISPQEALIKVDGKVRPDSIGIGAKNKIEIIRVVFGG